MKITNIDNMNEGVYDLLVIGVHKIHGLSYVSDAVEKTYNYLIKNHLFTRTTKKIECIRLIESNKCYMFINIDEASNKTVDVITMFNRLITEIKKEKVKSAVITFTDWITCDYKDLLVQCFLNSEYVFDKYCSHKKIKYDLEIVLYCNEAVDIESNINISDGIAIAKTLVNEPANYLVPERLAKDTLEYFLNTDVKVEIYDESDIEGLKMNALLAVSKGSINKPRLIVLTYMGQPECNEVTGLIGKGVTYDSGGFSLKGSKGMENMKNDMGGSAAVIGAMYAMGKNKSKVNTIAVIAACENILSRDAYYPGDVISSMSGKSIEVKNTDAEGRLTLADALTYIVRKKSVNRVISLATLTGAAANMFKKFYSPYISTDNRIFNILEESGEISGERVWRMPIIDQVNDRLKSTIADLKNSHFEGVPGMISAGMFIDKFSENTPLTHIDIAGKVLTDNLATGYGVKLLVNTITKL